MNHVYIGKVYRANNTIGRGDMDRIGIHNSLLGCSTLCNVIELGGEHYGLATLIRDLANYTYQSAEYWNSLSYSDRNQLTTAYITYRRSLIDDAYPSSWIECLIGAVYKQSLIDSFNNIVS